MEGFEVLRELGQGAYSKVFHVRRREDQKEYALKVVQLSKLDEKMLQNSLNEVRILASLHDPNIVSYKEAFLDQQTESLYIVMEYVDGGDLQQKIATLKRNGQSFPEAKIWSIFVQMVYGLRSLHELGIIHRDLKTANVFISQEGLVKLGDLNVSKVFKNQMNMTQTGTPSYASPEVWNNDTYSQKSDIWSLGVCFYEMLALNMPFQGQDMDQLFKRVTNGAYQQIPNHFSTDATTILQMLLYKNPDDRPSCQQLIELPVFQQHARESNNLMIEQQQHLKKQIMNNNNICSHRSTNAAYDLDNGRHRNQNDINQAQSKLLQTIRLSDNKGIFSQSMAKRLPVATYSDYLESSDNASRRGGYGGDVKRTTLSSQESLSFERTEDQYDFDTYQIEQQSAEIIDQQSIVVIRAESQQHNNQQQVIQQSNQIQQDLVQPQTQPHQQRQRQTRNQQVRQSKLVQQRQQHVVRKQQDHQNHLQPMIMNSETAAQVKQSSGRDEESPEQKPNQHDQVFFNCSTIKLILIWTTFKNK